MSAYEKAVAASEIIPERAMTRLARMTQEAKTANIDSLLVSSRSSDNLYTKMTQKSNRKQADNAKDQKLFTNILRKEGSDFLRLDLGKSWDQEIN